MGMNKMVVIVGGLALLVLAGARSSAKGQPGWLQQLTGWQKLFGVAAFLIALLILANPEFAAIGLLSDTAFFDVFVLALGMQLHTSVVRMLRTGAQGTRMMLRWTVMRSPGLCRLLVVLSMTMASLISVCQRVVHRFNS